MTRAIWFVVKLAVVVAVAVWLANEPGLVRIAWQGYLIETTVGVLVLAVLAVVLVVAILYRLWRALRGAPGELRERRAAARRERGYQALTQGLVAVAAGDAEAARRNARKADDLLRDPPLTMLLSAQAAQLNGDAAAARRYFTAMLDRPETRFLGLRGLLTLALREGRRDEALDLARRAHDLQPRTPWVLTTLFDLEARAGEWARADAIVQQALRQGVVPAEVGRRHRAALYVERSHEAERQARAGDALDLAARAHDLAPAFVPAAVRLARLQALAGKPKPAAKTIERTWRAAPHPELAEAYREIAPSLDPLAQVKRFEALQALAPDSAEGHLALARAALDARLWGEARNHLNKALAVEPCGRVYRMFAELEEGEHGNLSAAREWLDKAARAPAEPAWTCAACGGIARHWQALCPHCAIFDSLDWRRPDDATEAPPPLPEPEPVPGDVVRDFVPRRLGISSGTAAGHQPPVPPGRAVG